MSKKYILSISGGGIRGLIPSVFLHELYKRTGKHPTELFDFFTGTSTGGIISLLLTSPDKYSTQDILNFYLGENAKRIFKPNSMRLPWDSVKYPAKQIESVLQEKLKSYHLSECTKPTVITLYDMITRDSMFINSTEEKYSNFQMWECARATSAAPTYFSPFQLRDIVAIDGGVFANNPSLFCGGIEAHKVFPEDELVIVSLGTGSFTTPVSYKALSKWTILDWASQIYSICNDGQSDTTRYAMSTMVEKENYFSFDLKLPKGMDEMDNVKDSFLNDLVELSQEQLANDWKIEFNRLIEQLTAAIK